jgi:hypothetical protein
MRDFYSDAKDLAQILIIKPLLLKKYESVR